MHSYAVSCVNYEISLKNVRSVIFVMNLWTCYITLSGWKNNYSHNFIPIQRLMPVPSHGYVRNRYESHIVTGKIHKHEFVFSSSCLKNFWGRNIIALGGDQFNLVKRYLVFHDLTKVNKIVYMPLKTKKDLFQSVLLNNRRT